MLLMRIRSFLKPCRAWEKTIQNSGDQVDKNKTKID